MEERTNNFGKSEIICQELLKIDAKGRIVLPKATHATPEDRIALMYDLKRTKIIIEEYQKFEEHLDIISEQLDDLFRNKVLDYQQYHHAQLYIYGDGCLEPPTIVRAGRRITIPSRAIQKLNLGDTIYAVGNTVRISHADKELIMHRLELYPTEESYTLSKKNV